ncbi:MAG: copper transporter [Actinomycetaceae bacterium]|nr:copper transporter [Actinomycetaceae bacterium]
MVDFRYHLVSLISVFIALALGVVLGAGPLQTPIASGLTNQVEQLRELQTKKTEEVEASREEITKRNDWIHDITEQLLPGTLENHSVALITFDETRGEDIDAIRQYLELAGATVNQRVTVDPKWYSMDLMQFRRSLSGPIADNLTNQQTTETAPEAILAHGLLEVITTDSESSSFLREMFTDSDNALVSFDTDPAVSDTIVIIGGPTATDLTDDEEVEPAPEPTEGTDEVDTQMITQLAAVMALAPHSAVVVGDASAENGLVSLIRSDAVEVTTVDSAGTAMANSATVLALPTAEAKSRAFGYASSAQEHLPTLP